MASRAQGLLESPSLCGLIVFIISIGPLVMCLIVDAFGGVLFVVVVVVKSAKWGYFSRVVPY